MWLRCGQPFQHLKALGRSSTSSWILQACFLSDTPQSKSKLAPLQERRMVDRFQLWAKGGDGGNGCSSYRRSRHDRHGRPDGGNGGRGGDVILECSHRVWDLSSLQHHINAKRGEHGASKNQIGSRGADKIVLVPVGTVIHVVEGEIPSAVEIEKSSSTALDPWEIPGELIDNSSECAEKSVNHNTSCIKRVGSLDVNGVFDSGTKTSIELTSTKQAAPAFALQSLSHPSSFLNKSRICEEDPVIEEVDDMDCEGLVTDYHFSEEEWEDEMEEEEQHIQYNVAELTEPGQRIIVAQGGVGGMGNVCWAKSSKNPDLGKPGVPRDDDEQQLHSVGLLGSEVVLLLELKSIADVGLVGMPNAGKSTLLGAISRAKPTVGHYAFTTLRPNLGNLNYDDFSITIADIPGLIKGAHENRGLGHAFLRHIERTKVLAYVLDLAAALDGRKGIQPWEQLKDLVLELEFYSEGLSDRPSIVVANKIDEEGAEEVYEELKSRVPGVPIYPVCAVLEEGVQELKDGLRMLANGIESQRVRLDGIMLD